MQRASGRVSVHGRPDHRHATAKGTRGRRWLRCAGLAALAIAAAAATALAQAPDTPVSSGRIARLAAGSGERPWTEERMRNARPMPIPEISASQTFGLGVAPAPAGLPVVAGSGAVGDAPDEPVTPDAALSLQGPVPVFGTTPFSYTRYRLFPDLIATYKAFPYRTVGKLFFTIPGSGDFVCSGASVSSTNRSVVWTAGHCVASPGIGFHTNFSFSPARRLGSNPYGLWTPLAADGVWTLNGWLVSGLFSYDHGALVMQPKAGVRLGNKVGFLGFAANVARQQHWHVHGYPQSPRNLAQTPPGAQFTGVHHEICAAAWGADDATAGGPGDPAAIGIGCDHTGGTSGGPWVINFTSASGTLANLLNGNNSYKYLAPVPPENLKLFSPYFGDAAVNLRNAAQAIVP
jgi:V8-like Glu-specific endopeptidase